VATLWEAALGTGNLETAQKWNAEADALKVADWMQETRKSQGKRLEDLLKKYSELLNTRN
jgi:hypothetical protein